MNTKLPAFAPALRPLFAVLCLLAASATTLTLAPRANAAAVTKAAAGGYHSLYVTDAGALWAVGDNTFGQLGDGTDSPWQTSRVQVATGVIDVAAGCYHSLFLKNDGALWAMGSDIDGELGDGAVNDGTDLQYQNPPVRVADGVKAVAAGNAHSLFLKNDGTLWAMGANSLGQLGDGTTTYRRTPVQIADSVTAVAAGDAHSLFLKNDNTLWAMGANDYGQLGDGTTTTRRAPVRVADNVKAVSAGNYHTLFLKYDGTLWAVGANDCGQLADGTTTQRLAPVQVAAGVMTMAAGGSCSLYVGNDGTLWAVGCNSTGQLGDGTTTTRRAPVQIAAGVTAVTASKWRQGHTLFIKNNGTLWAMGYNNAGQLGDGTKGDQRNPNSADRHAPVYIAGGGGPVITTQPVSQNPAAGALVTFGVVADGSAPLTYQWQKNSADIPGATASTYTIKNAQPPDAGNYRVIVTDATGPTPSEVATLSIAGYGAGDGNSDGAGGSNGGGGGAPSLLQAAALALLATMRVIKRNRPHA